MWTGYKVKDDFSQGKNSVLCPAFAKETIREPLLELPRRSLALIIILDQYGSFHIT